MILTISACVYIFRRVITSHRSESTDTSQAVNPLFAENEEYVTEEEYWEQEEQGDDDEYADADEFDEEEYNDEPYEEEYIEQQPYGYDERYADDPEPSDWGSSHDSQTECDDFHREHSEDDRWQEMLISNSSTLWYHLSQRSLQTAYAELNAWSSPHFVW